ncbi:aggregation-promoting factor C-terminal-like domain-containing protein [Actinomyces weissii]|uniref:CHAP domain-containing protein n=1 Tax=Actinomyces weissii TaxID=675090 RepID=A0A7T7MAR1_9ACTO|nr:CHAP domain-containing protein [Actinomyces weissii]QQM67472.1 CHAP domain-containing protein [Actinomyces weissii]
MATPSLNIRGTEGAGSLIEDHVSKVTVSARVSHALEVTGRVTGDVATTAARGTVVAARYGAMVGKAGVKVGKAGAKVGGKGVAAGAKTGVAFKANVEAEDSIAVGGGKTVAQIAGKKGAQLSKQVATAPIKVATAPLKVAKASVKAGRRYGANQLGLMVERSIRAKAGVAQRNVHVGLTGKVRRGSGILSKGSARAAKAGKKVGKTASKNILKRAADVAVRIASRIIGKIVAVLALKATAVLLVIMALCAIVVLVLAVIASFIPSWLAGDEADNPPTSGAGVAGVVVAGMGNDYPYKDRPYNTVNITTQYYFGNCTDFAIWRVNRDDGDTTEPWTHTNANTTPAGGHGYQWGAPSALPGWEIVKKPSPGDIISFAAGSEHGRWNSLFGHVAYIGQVSADGSMVTENYGTGEYFQMTYTGARVAELVSSGQAVIKHNPHSKVKVVTENGVSTVSNVHLAPAGTTAAAAQETARKMMPSYGWDNNQFACLVELWNHESGWNYQAENPSSGAYGIPQSLPASKMAAAGPDWRTNPATQIKWGMDYIAARPDYGNPCAAWALWQARSPHWY